MGRLILLKSFIGGKLKKQKGHSLGKFWFLLLKDGIFFFFWKCRWWIYCPPNHCNFNYTTLMKCENVKNAWTQFFAPQTCHLSAYKSCPSQLLVIIIIFSCYRYNYINNYICQNHLENTPWNSSKYNTIIYLFIFTLLSHSRERFILSGKIVRQVEKLQNNLPTQVDYEENVHFYVGMDTPILSLVMKNELSVFGHHAKQL